MATKTKFSSSPHYIIGEDFIVVTHNGKPHTVYEGDARFHNLKNVITKGNWNHLESALSAAKTIEKYGFGKVKVFENEIHYDGKPVHSAITKRVFEFISQNHPFEHLVKFMDKIMLNPSERSREQLLHYLDLYKLPIDENGDFLAYKAVNSNFKDLYTGTIDNSVGKIVKVDRKRVDDDPYSACSYGLHLGNWGFISGSYNNPDYKILLLRVNPMNVVSVPHDANSQKMRVCEYEVVKLVGKPSEVVDFNSNSAKANATTKDVASTNAKSQILGANRAYEIHKEGKQMLQTFDGNKYLIVLPEEKKPRSFFRSHKNWEIAVPREIIPTNGVKVGSNRAYDLHKQGADLQSLTVGVVKKGENKTRKFFRQHNDWYQV